MIIIKAGGSAGINYEAVCDDIAELRSAGQPLVFIHGGSNKTNEIAEALGHPPQFITSPSGYTSRLTDHQTMEIFQMVYCGLINKQMVERLQRRGINAIGLSGMDGHIWQGPRKKAVRAVSEGRQRVIRDNYTGKVDLVNTTLLRDLLAADLTPVLTPPAISYEAEPINVDGDRAAAATAIALDASQLIILSNTPGVLANFPDENSLIPHIAPKDIDKVRQEAAAGRMRIKLLGAEEALNGGVQRVILGDARIEKPILSALLGKGTVIS